MSDATKIALKYPLPNPKQKKLRAKMLKQRMRAAKRAIEKLERFRDDCQRKQANEKSRARAPQAERAKDLDLPRSTSAEAP